MIWISTWFQNNGFYQERFCDTDKVSTNWFSERLVLWQPCITAYFWIIHGFHKGKKGSKRGSDYEIKKKKSVFFFHFALNWEFNPSYWEPFFFHILIQLFKLFSSLCWRFMGVLSCAVFQAFLSSRFACSHFRISVFVPTVQKIGVGCWCWVLQGGPAAYAGHRAGARTAPASLHGGGCLQQGQQIGISSPPQLGAIN